jgi:hypothetical protein
MGKAPAFPFYAADYLADETVSLMTLEEEGALARAKAYCWREGSIPADESKLSRLLKNASNQTVRLVRECFIQCPNDASRLISQELEELREKQRLWKEKSAEAGKKSGKSRREKKLHTEPTFNEGSDLVEPKSNSSFAFASSSSSNISTKTKAKATPEASPSAFEVPGWIPADAWAGFEEMRRKIRAPLTDMARTNIIKDLEKLRDSGQMPGDVLDQSTSRSWRGVFAIKAEGDVNGRDGRQAGNNERISPAFIEQIAVARRSMKPEEEEELSLLLDQTILRYPHQDLSRAIDGFYHDYTLLCERYGLPAVKQALQELRLMPGQRFFPQPSECAEVAEEIVKRRKAEEAKANAFRPCGKCYSGLVRVVKENGMSVMRDCQCLQDHKAGRRLNPGLHVVDYKSRSSGTA